MKFYFDKFKKYALFLLENESILDELMLAYFKKVRSSNIPMMRFLERLPADQHKKIADKNIENFLQHCLNDTAFEDSIVIIDQWKSNELLGVPKEEVEVADILTVTNFRKQLYIDFLDRYTQDISLFRAIVAELDEFHMQFQKYAFDSYVAIHQEELAKENKFTYSLINNSVDGILAFDEQLKVTECNQVLEKWYGIKKEEVIGKDILKVFSAYNGSVEGNPLVKALEGKKTFIPEQPFQGREGYYEANIVPLYDNKGLITGGIINTHDITRRKEAEEEIKETKHLLQEITDAVPNVIYVSDYATKKAVFVNKEITSLAGYTTEEVKSFSRDKLTQLIHPDDFPALEKQAEEISSLKNGEVSFINVRIRHKDGRWRWIRVKSKILKNDENGEPLQTIRVFEDVTEIIEAQRTIQQQNEGLAASNEELAASLEELQAALEELQTAEEQLREMNEELEFRVEDRTKELAEREKELKQREEQLRLITDAVPAMISYIRKDGTYGFVNKAYEKVFQINKKNIIGKPVKEIIGEKAFSKSFPLIEKALRGEFVESEILQDYGPKVGKKWRRASFVPHQVGDNTIGTYVLVEDITKFKNIQIEQELAYQKLKEKDDFYKALIEHGSDFITVFDEKLNYIYSGGAILRELGYKPEQLIGENPFNFVHPDDILKVKELLSQVLTSQEPVKLSEIRFKNAMGEWRWLEGTLKNQLNNPAVKGVVVSSRDITERVSSRLKHQESEQRFKSLFDNHLDIVLFQNKEGIIIDVNAATISFFGIQKQEIVKQPFSDFLPPETIPHCDQTLQKALNGESVRFELGIPFEGKGICTFDIAKMPVVVEGEIIGVFSILRDITAKKEAEEYQLEITNDLFRQNRDLQQFTYIVSHNLRSPVASIMGLADLLTTTEGNESETFEVSLRYLKRTADQLDTVLRDLNHTLSIRNKKDSSAKEKVNLALVCQQVITSLQDSLHECGGIVYTDIEEDTFVNGNKGYIYSILHNLLSNSIKYRSSDRHLEVRIKCFNSANRGTVISFSDNGVGFDVEKAGDNVFKLYKRFHTNYEGRGIGLFLVKTHVEAMDGHIEVNSQVNAGTTFLIYLK